MAVPKKIINFLDKNKVEYKIVEHKKAYTSLNKAESLGLKPNIVVKTLVIKADKDIVLVSLAANKNLDKQALKKLINKERKREERKAAKKIDFASERILKNKFKGVKLGVVPPFGSLFRYPLFIQRSLLKQKEIVVNSGDYTSSIKMKPSALEKLALVLISGSFSRARK